MIILGARKSLPSRWQGHDYRIKSSTFFASKLFPRDLWTYERLAFERLETELWRVNGVVWLKLVEEKKIVFLGLWKKMDIGRAIGISGKLWWISSIEVFVLEN